MSELALFGGSPVLGEPLSPYKSLSVQEEHAVVSVVRSGCLSGFYGSWEDGFRGGQRVQEFETQWAARFKTAHAVSVNSNTSGLFAAIGAAGIGPADEVILPCTTMSATAMAPLVYGGIPVFADIEKETFCIDLTSVRKNLSERTKAIIAVNLFGHAARLAELRQICDRRGIILIEDNAQAPLATEAERYCGTIGHIGVFSLNYHKHIHTGEGGMCCTDDDALAERLRMIRNHAEAIVDEAKVTDLTNMVGFNYRLTELQAAVGLVQLENIDQHVDRRCDLGQRLSSGLSDLKGITVPVMREKCRHVYYGWVPRYNGSVVGPKRETFVKALNAEGFPCGQGYVKPLYHLPLFQQRKAFGRDGYPFTLTNRKYELGLCPVAEKLHELELIVFEPCAWEADDSVVDKLIEAFCKVHAAREKLVEWEYRRGC